VAARHHRIGDGIKGSANFAEKLVLAAHAAAVLTSEWVLMPLFLNAPFSQCPFFSGTCCESNCSTFSDSWSP